MSNHPTDVQHAVTTFHEDDRRSKRGLGFDYSRDEDFPKGLADLTIRDEPHVDVALTDGPDTAADGGLESATPDFLRQWHKLPLELQQHILRALLEDSLSPESAEKSYFMPPGGPGSKERPYERPSKIFYYGLILNLIRFCNLRFLGSNIPYVLQQFRKNWTTARKEQASELMRRHREKHSTEVQSLFCTHIRECDHLVSHAQWLIGDPAGKENKDWEKTQKMAIQRQKERNRDQAQYQLDEERLARRRGQEFVRGKQAETEARADLAFARAFNFPIVRAADRMM